MQEVNGDVTGNSLEPRRKFTINIKAVHFLKTFEGILSNAGSGSIIMDHLIDVGTKVPDSVQIEPQMRTHRLADNVVYSSSDTASSSNIERRL